MILTDVCRLCLAEENLVWIFDKRFENSQNMKDVIFMTTGVEIHVKDVISQKICKKCCEIAIKMLQFRTKSLENNLYLKELLKEYLKNGTVKIPNTNVTIQSEKNESKKDDKPIVSKSTYKVHTSVQSLFRVYPQIKIPTKCLEFDIDPHVFMTMDSVENYFIERKIDMNKHIQLALRRSRGPKKPQSIEGVVTDNIVMDTRPEKSNTPSSRINDNDGISPKTNVDSNKDCEQVEPVNIKVNKENTISKINVQENTGLNETNIIKHSTETTKSSDNTSKTEKLQGSKRKLSESYPTEVKKPTFIKSLELIQKTNDSAETMYVDKSIPLFICDICNSVQYNARDLKKHQIKHLRCQFCKAKFRNMEFKRQHLESSCPIKNIMNNLPSVYLTKLETDKEIRIKYPNAFIDFPSIRGIDLIVHDQTIIKAPISPKTEQLQNSKRKNIDHITADNTSMEVIEILSDDDRTETDINDGKANTAKKMCTTVNSSTNCPLTPAKIMPGTDTNSHVTPVNAANPAIMANPLVSNTNENIVYNTVSIVKPDIKIKNSQVLEKFDSKDSDIKVMKELLSNPKIVKFTKEAFVQTESPSNEKIVINEVDSTCDMLFLKNQLHMYRIPVNVKNGHYHVSYSYEKPPEKMKKMFLWNDLVPTEIKFRKNKASTVKSNSTVPATNAQIHTGSASVLKNINKKLISSVCSTALPTSAPSTMKLPDRLGQRAPNTVKVYKNKSTPSSVVPTPLLIGPGQNIAGVTANHQNKLVVPMAPVVSTTVVLNGTVTQNMNIFSTSGPNNNPNIMLSAVPSACTPLTGTETNVAVTYGNSYNYHYTSPITTSPLITNVVTNPLIPINNVTHPNPNVLIEPSNNSSIATNLPNPSNLLNNYICNSSVPGYASSPLSTNDVNPKPGAIRVKNVWELK